jgi:hypothetical protein
MPHRGLQRPSGPLRRRPTAKQRSSVDALVLWLLNLSLSANGWPLKLVLVPLGRAVAFNVVCVRRSLSLAQWVTELVLKAIAWIGAPVSRESWLLERLGIKRVHALLGELSNGVCGRPCFVSDSAPWGVGACSRVADVAAAHVSAPRQCLGPGASRRVGTLA